MTTADIDENGVVHVESDDGQHLLMSLNAFVQFQSFSGSEVSNLAVTGVAQQLARSTMYTHEPTIDDRYFLTLENQIPALKEYARRVAQSPLFGRPEQVSLRRLQRRRADGDRRLDGRRAR